MLWQLEGEVGSVEGLFRWKKWQQISMQRECSRVGWGEWGRGVMFWRRWEWTDFYEHGKGLTLALSRIWVIVGEAESMATKGEGASSERGSKYCRLQITWWPQWSCQVWNPEFWRPAMLLRFPFKARALPPGHFCSFPFPPHCLFAMHDLLVYWWVGVRKKKFLFLPNWNLHKNIIEDCIWAGEKLHLSSHW